MYASGGGTVQLGGARTYTGSTAVTSGTFIFGGTHTSATAVDFSTFGTDTVFAGSGVLPGPLTIVGQNSTLSPGVGAGGMGTISAQGFFIASASQIGTTTKNYIVDLDVEGPVFNADALVVREATPGSGTSVDVTGMNLQFAFTASNGNPFAPGTTFIVVQKEGTSAVTGPFASTPAQVPGVLSYIISYTYTGTDARGLVGDGNDIAITFSEVPEPGSLAVSSAAAIVLTRRARARRQRSSFSSK